MIYAYIPNAEVWDAALKFTGDELSEIPPYPTDSLARCTSLHHGRFGTVCLVTVNDKMVSDFSPLELMCLVAHEATHVHQFFFDDHGEEKPGVETQAYMTQYITMNIVRDYLDYHKKEIKYV